MKKQALLQALQPEIHRHTFDYFVGSPPAVAEGGTGSWFPDVQAAEKRVNTMAHFSCQIYRGIRWPVNEA
jgi:hypothetical protein